MSGTGFIGSVHVEALRRLGIRVIGLLSSSRARSEKAGRELGFPKAYATYDEILSDSEADVIDCGPPNHLHRAVVIRTLKAGKHVVRENQPDTGSVETAELVELTRKNPRLVAAVRCNARFYSLALHTRALLQENVIGRVSGVRGAFVEDLLLEDTDWIWRLLVNKGVNWEQAGT